LAVTFLAAASHGLLDAATDAGKGIGLFIPLSNERIFFEFRPIRTATVNPLTFFQRRSLTILWSEVMWVWLPLFSMSLVYQIGRYLRHRVRKRALMQQVPDH
jgi:inner membrane protein